MSEARDSRPEVIGVNPIIDLDNGNEMKMGWVFSNEIWRNPPSLVAQMVRHLSSMLETQVRSLGQEDPPEKEMATHSSTLAWKIPWKDDPGRLQSMGPQRAGHDWATLLTYKSDPVITFQCPKVPHMWGSKHILVSALGWSWKML